MPPEYAHPTPVGTRSQMSAGRVMGWFVVLGSMLWARAGILALWIFSDLLGDAYDSWLLPAVGFFVVPWTTATYALMWGVSSDGVYGVEWVLVAGAALVDLVTYAGWRALRH